MYNATLTQPVLRLLTSVVHFDNTTSTSESYHDDHGDHVVQPLDVVMATIYGLICVVGLIGHGLVLSAVFSDNKEGDENTAVTDVYIASLSLADSTFLIGLPFIIVTGLAKRWLFGSTLCKVYFMATCVSSFADAFTLTAMSGDRCTAVCCSLVLRRCHCRTTTHARSVVIAVWTFATAAALPVVIYAQLIPNALGDSCTVRFPDDTIDASLIYSLYTLVLFFIIPVLLISIFYAGIIVKLHGCRTSAPTTTGNTWHRSKRYQHHTVFNRWRSRRITWLVTSIVVVYVACWLPYWVFQVHLIVCQRQDNCEMLPLPKWKVFMFQLFTVLSYANSAINPFLYAFTSSLFRQRFRLIYNSWFSDNDNRGRAAPTVRISPSRSVTPGGAVTKTQTGSKVRYLKSSNPDVSVGLSVVVELHNVSSLTVPGQVRDVEPSGDEIVSSQLTAL